ncbi:MAG: hypothetical protein JNL28_06845 [Planctomycetes bacterium]|nr:hypothetical protein [Planctomycetota bacterium]
MQAAVEVRSTRRAVTLALIGLLGLVALMTVTRVRATLADPNFDAHDASGLLKSDPALLYYMVERVIESNGAIPDDWRADPRIEHPALYDFPARLPVAQEFVVAWLRLAAGEALPLHVFCLWVAGAFASLVLIGVWLLAFELSGSAWLALLSALLAALLPATWRTLGFVLMDEDFSLPFFALHLGLLARAARVRTPLSFFLAGAALACALSTWHAASFLFALEAIAIAAWAILQGANPLRSRGAWVCLIPIVLAAFGVPFLRASGFIGSIGATLCLALSAEALVPQHLATRISTRLRLVVMLALGLVLANVFAETRADHSHVVDLLSAKLAHLGARPENPLALTPDVRLMWQGPFETLSLSAAWSLLGFTLLLVPLAAVRAYRLVAGEPLALAALFTCITLVAGWLVLRVVVLPAVLLPAMAVPLLARSWRARPVRLALVALVVLQGLAFGSWIHGYSNPWYAAPVQRQAEIRALVQALPALVPSEEAVAADSMNATAILVHTRRRAILSPKWESRASRARVVEFTTAFFAMTPDEFRTLLLSKYKCRYLLVDRFTLGYLSAYAAGVGNAEPRPGTTASLLLSTDGGTLTGVPGYRLLYRSPPSILQSNGAPTDFFRLYVLDESANPR